MVFLEQFTHSMLFFKAVPAYIVFFLRLIFQYLWVIVETDVSQYRTKLKLQECQLPLKDGEDVCGLLVILMPQQYGHTVV